uniref:Uncharacterized protein n=1 Tax=Anguilla anguilla TaxID=7936 RepID=A0A0E9WEN0_ANGAN
MGYNLGYIMGVPNELVKNPGCIYWGNGFYISIRDHFCAFILTFLVWFRGVCLSKHSYSNMESQHIKC